MIVTKRIILHLGNIDSIFLLDESLLEPIVLKRTRWVLRRERRSNPPDLSDNAMELYAHIMSINSYFIVRLKDKSYIEDRYKITENDAEIKLELTKERLKKFHNKDLKEKYSK